MSRHSRRWTVRYASIDSIKSGRNPRQRRTQDGQFLSHVTKDQRRRIMKRERNVCAYCKERPATQIDHVIPLWRGGESIDSNLVAACAPCNYSKGAKVGGWWAEVLQSHPRCMWNAQVSLVMAREGLETIAEYREWRARRNTGVGEATATEN